MDHLAAAAGFSLLVGEAGFDPIEERLRTNVRATIEAVFAEELTEFPGRLRCDRGAGPAKAVSPHAPRTTTDRYIRNRHGSRAARQNRE